MSLAVSANVMRSSIIAIASGCSFAGRRQEP